jgi:hypothetical protein
MQSVYEWFLKIFQNCKTWYYHFVLSEATKAEVDEWYREQERERAEEEANEAMWLADYIQQQEQVLADRLAEEEYARQEEENRKYHEEVEEREKLNELLRNEQEEDRYRCPLCDTPWVSFGRCKPCDRAFGRD